MVQALIAQPSPRELTALAIECFDDPVLFVETAFPWGEYGTILEYENGPDDWQSEVLENVREHIQTSDEGYRIAVSSGHGVGKSALASWLILWFMVTRPDPQALITANTQQQLRTKTWRELAKWHKLCFYRAWFRWTATMFYHVEAPETWFTAAIPWSEEKPEAFQGTHERDVLVIYDESSAIADIIYESTEGAMTTPGAFWFTFGNATRNIGMFYESLPGGRFAHRWNHRAVDSRHAKKADQRQIAQWIEDHGEGSDFVRVRVKGLPPTSALPGSYYAEEFARIDEEGRVCEVPYDPLLPVYTAWDIGINDTTAIWFFQPTVDSVRFIDYEEGHSRALIYEDDPNRKGWIDIVREKPYNYDHSKLNPPLTREKYEVHYGPHDLDNRIFSTGKTTYGIALQCGLRFTIVQTGTAKAFIDGIAATRRLLARAWFDRDKCEQGIACMRSYRREWNDERLRYSDHEHKDWTNNGADAGRHAAIGLMPPKEPLVEQPQPGSFIWARKQAIAAQRGRRTNGTFTVNHG